MKPVINIRYINFFAGFDDENCRRNVLMDLCDEYDFVFGDPPDILLIGCYGQELPQPSKAIRIGYYTENEAPDLVNFDYFFGCEYPEHVADSRYCKRIYGPPPPDRLFAGCSHPEREFGQKTKFCNFIYSNPIPYRERFFDDLQRYRPITAPGRSRNNCFDLASRAASDWRREKLNYMRQFKFTIAFENSRRIGYASEKLYDALLADTVPIYWGDPCVARIVNPDALVIVDGDWERDVLPWLILPEKRQPYRPAHRVPSPMNKLFGRANDVTMRFRARLPYRKDFAAAIEEIIRLDRDDDAYKAKLAAPRLNKGLLELRQNYFEFWRAILRKVVSSTP